jgi:hypothetical protein
MPEACRLSHFLNQEAVTLVNSVEKADSSHQPVLVCYLRYVVENDHPQLN